MTRRVMSSGVVLMAAMWTACACTTAGVRGPTSAGDTKVQIQGDLHSQVEDMLGFVQSPRLTPENCGPVLSDIFKQAFALNPTQLDVATLRGRGAQIIENLFLIRHHLRARLAEFDRAGKVNEACLHGIRDSFRAARVMEDYIAEWYADYPVNQPDAPVGALNGRFPWIQLHPGRRQLDYRSGDVFISRGNAFTSAAISRITDDDANFSHLAILYIDEKTGEKWMVEAHIEIGSEVAKFEDYRFDGKSRAVQLRFEDPEVAHRSAKMIYEKVTAATASGKNICYDFGMDMVDRKCLFCSEVVSLAFALGSGERVQLPRFQSKIQMKNRTFVSRIGVTATQTFAPADIELDPRFTVLSEWRDLGKVNKLHEYDAILTAMFDWMDRENYVLQDAYFTSAKSAVLHRARKWPVFGSVLKRKFPKNMKLKTLATVFTLDDVGETLLNHLETVNVENRRKTGFWLTPRQMLETLEEFRKQDLQIYKSGRRSQFHSLLRPK